MTVPPSFILPSDIPWADLKGDDLEELLYWLLDAMGAKNLTWRAGGSTGSAADGGRDIEAVMHEATDEGTLEPRTWWIEAKGRSSTLAKDAVTSAASSALAYDVDVLVVATNSRFSNPTRDWVEAFNRTHDHPTVRLWDRDEIERLIVSHPLVAARVLPEILSPSGRLTLQTERFWQRHELFLESDLKFFWDNNDVVAAAPETLLPIIISETAQGDLNARPWLALDLPDDAYAQLLVIALTSLLPLGELDGRRGLSAELLSRSTADIVLSALQRLGADVVVSLAKNPWRFVESDFEPGPTVIEQILGPIVENARVSTAKACTCDCDRISVDFPDDADPQAHWKKFFDAPGAAGTDDRYLVFEYHDKPCAIGLGTGSDWSCPVMKGGEWTTTLHDLEPVLEARIAHILTTDESAP